MHKQVEDWRLHVEPFLKSKLEEFLLMGYSRATIEDIWQCLEKNVWKGTPTKKLYEIVQDIMHLRASVYMNYLTVKAYQDDDLMASIEALMDGDQIKES